MSEKECIGNLGGPQIYLVNLPWLHILRMLLSPAVLGVQHPVRQLDGAPLLVHIRQPHHKIRIRTVAGYIEPYPGIPGDRQGLCENRRCVGENIRAFLFLRVVLRHLQLIFRHIHQMDGGVLRIIHIAVLSARSLFLKGQAAFPAGDSLPARAAIFRAVKIQPSRPPALRRPRACTLPAVFSQGVILHSGRLLYSIVRPSQKMIQPLHAQQIDVIADGVLAHILAVKVIVCIPAVLPGPQNRLPGSLRPFPHQIQGLRGAHSVVVKPA